MLLQTLGYDAFWLYSISAVVMVSMITTILSCLCCRRKQEIKNDLLGLEGMVKLTNPEDTLLSSGSTGAINAQANTGNGTLGTNTANASNLRPASVGGGFSSDTESSSKRTSNAPHRSLPDIPIAEPAGDNNSELYATVGDKVQDLPQGRSPSASLKKQTSVSQHSSISQADDISSPYARVRSPPHAYDKLRRMEHPYAQVVPPGSAVGSTVFEAGTGGPSGTASRSKPRDGDDDDEEDDDDDELMSPISRRESAQNIEDRETSTVDIPAASAIAGRVSASQDLPYMTPPIVQPSSQHFSGDSQDSSKGYTSISVREPLANLLPQNMPNQTTAKRRQILGDSHYATVSDDSDEMYAAIDDPGNQGDLYTSGSETYAQIQPPNAMTVSVEINTGASSRPQPPSVQTLHATVNDALDSAGISSSNKTNSAASNRLSNHSNMVTSGDEHTHGLPPHLVPSTASIDGGGLRAQTFVQHSRQASSSSCTSSVGNLGSPKPEKRQANSPLPPTPKTLKHQANNFFSTSNQSMIGSGSVASSSTTTVTSGRNSVASVIECGGVGSTASNRENIGNKQSADIDSTMLTNGSIVSGKQKKSPSKDLEGMYAKVMKKNKLSKVPSQNSSPVPLRKDGSVDAQHVMQQLLTDSDMSQLNGGGSLQGGSPNKNMVATQRNSTANCQNKDPGYETIPGDNVKAGMETARKSADYAQIQKSHRIHTAGGGTTMANVFLASGEGNPLSAVVAQADTEPGYESLPDTRGSINDPGYETLNRGSNRTESDSDPNYEILRPAGSKPSTTSQPSGISKLRGGSSGDTNRDSDGYSSIRETAKTVHSTVKNGARNRLDFGARRAGPGTAEDEDTDSSTPGYSSIKEKDDYDPGYSVISERKNPPPGHDYASITEEAKKRKPNINNNVEPDDESDIYSSIPHTASGTLTLPSPSAAVVIGGSSLGANSPGCAGTTMEADRTSAGAGMGTLSSSPGYSSISETRTTPSSTDGDGDGSTSSPDQLIGYSKHNSNTNTTVTTNNSLSRISSNYESLTGSESDPNYESVKYLNVKENPYERLHNESGGGAGGNSSGGIECVPKSLTNDSLTTDSDTATPTPVTQTSTPAGIANVRRAMGTPDSDGTAPAVSDYFQV
ncbi:mucin-5AC isoform X1 [Anopheles funestus]|uniref:mucin-5AC isoform X1 n=1 Tax=Anopheles funestus TaxID=62324 RepID=UPI0020C63E4A|nr:mucin-5AC isoform X1 [Anopheles funestus]XP_049300670.1 mucin-5AC isoform X1 [Anopheles funestus]XP_049300671.1 mucin-5AC isoform X1 [Anopheles funestus]XP_049300672.1 mucin-5AC isoform X1 [Anopheles funestus]XP_049300673.1 mucin-5AC isoform X1 [Anopheles funestus]